MSARDAPPEQSHIKHKGPLYKSKSWSADSDMMSLRLRTMISVCTGPS